jgi:hypothetical protein
MLRTVLLRMVQKLPPVQYLARAELGGAIEVAHRLWCNCISAAVSLAQYWQGSINSIGTVLARCLPNHPGQ